MNRNHFIALAAALLSSGCTALVPAPEGCTDGLDMSVVELNIAPYSKVSEMCGRLGFVFVAGCICFTEDLKPQTEGPQSGCRIPVGKTAVIWSVDDDRTIDHEKCHAARDWRH